MAAEEDVFDFSTSYTDVDVEEINDMFLKLDSIDWEHLLEETVVRESVSSVSQCNLCGTITTQGSNCKHCHDTQKMTDKDVGADGLKLIIENLVKETANEMASDLCYTEAMRNDMAAFSVDTISPIFYELALPILEKLKKSLDLDKFYIEFYKVVVTKAREMFPMLTGKAAPFLAIKLSDSLTSITKAESNISDKVVSLSFNERNALCYLAGYVLRKIHNQILDKCDESQRTVLEDQWIQILLHTKSSILNEPQLTLAINLNRGGLWIINKPMENIITRAEFAFLEYTKSSGLRIINTLVQDLIQDNPVLKNFHSIIDSCDIDIERQTALPILFKILKLFI